MMQYLFLLKLWFMSRFNQFIKDERGDVNIVSIVVIIGIAVVLAIIFKDAISSLIQTLLNTITGGAINAVSE